MSLIETIKRISADERKASKPVEVVFGTVLSSNPLKIKIDQLLVLSEPHLILGNHKEFNDGDWVILLRIQGGKKYLILDKEIGEE